MALISKASLLMVPSTYEPGTLYNVLPSGNRAPDSTDQNSGYDNTRADFDFDRGSNAAATRIGSDGLIKKYRENLLVQSNQFDTTWIKSIAGVTGGEQGYDGSNDAWLLTSSSSSQYLAQNVSLSGVKTFSIYAKKGTTDGVVIRFLGGSNPYVFWNLNDGSYAGSGGGASIVAYDSASVGNEWYRVSITMADSSTAVRIYCGTASGSFATGSILIQSAQLESGLVATDYLESTSVTAKAGVLVDLPRINYDANGENGSLLLEPSRQQLFQYSEWFDNSYWARLGSGGGNAPIVTQNHAISPEGFKNASRVQFDTNGSTSTHRSGFVHDFAFTTGDKYAISCWVKSASGSDEIFTFRIAGAQVGGEKTATNEWQLFTETHTATATTTDNFGIQIRGNYSSQTSDILIYGMQLESGVTYATSYIPNHGESGGVTRAADSCSVTGVSDVIGQSEGTMYVEGNALANDLSYRSIGLNSGSATNRLLITFNNVSNNINFLVQVGSITQVNMNYTNATITDKMKIAFAYKANDFVAYVNGTQVATDTSGSTYGAGVLTDVTFDNAAGADKMVADLKNLTLFKERLTNAELATLTTL